MATVIDRCKTEGVVDDFQVVKALHVLGLFLQMVKYPLL